MQIQGKLIEKFDIKQVSDTFKVREFVVEYADNPLYPQFISFQLTQDRCGLIEPMSQGAMIQVEFNLRGRKWTSPQGDVKYFNTLEAWRISPVSEQVASPGQMPPPPVPPEAMDVTNMPDSDDLPF
ncbi:MAG: DUF3127 domain-containing protein [Bacteroidota bacterium]